jgi:hypothetical protein
MIQDSILVCSPEPRIPHTAVPVDYTTEVNATRSLGGRNTHEAPKDFGTKNNADMRMESTNCSSSLHNSIVFHCIKHFLCNIKIEACHLVIMCILQMLCVSVGWQHASHRRRIYLANHVIKTPYVIQLGIKTEMPNTVCGIWTVFKMKHVLAIRHIFCKYKSRTANRTAFLSMNVVGGLPYNATYPLLGEDVTTPLV